MLLIPLCHPKDTLRRVWLTPLQEERYYYGFANEGLWPLCHIAHTRPVFRAEDWEAYREVNVKFADAVLEEMADVEHPTVLVQDYHFALLPRLIKQRRPDARVTIFWHIFTTSAGRERMMRHEPFQSLAKPGNIRFEEIPESLREGAELVLDGGELPGTPSTVIDLRGFAAEGSWNILREGALPREAVETALAGLG